MNKTSMYAVALAIIIIGGLWYFLDRKGNNGLASVNQTDSYSTSTGSTAPNTTVAPAQVPINNQNIMLVTFHTNKGEIAIELFAKEKPKTVENFVKLAKAGFYDGVKFHRVIKDFMIQGGDPLSKDDSKKDLWGTGGPGYSFNDEIGSSNRNDIGTISMANAGPNTNGSQFFINVANNNFLDTKHTVFGKVTKGMNVVEAIEATAVGANDRPVEAMVINKITVE
jgi:peptidylprolyl isomerase